MKRTALHVFGILIGTAMMVSTFNNSPSNQTGNEAFDQGGQVGGWTFIAAGVVIIIYNVARIIETISSRNDGPKTPKQNAVK